MNKIKNTALFLIYAFLIVLCAVTVSDMGGIWRTIPFAFILPALATFLYNRKTLTVILTFFAVFTVCSAQSENIIQPIITAVISTVFAFLGIYVKRLIVTAFVCDGKHKKVFCLVLAGVISIISVCLYFSRFGNPVSCLIYRQNNVDYIEENYPGHDLSIKNTIYDFSAKRYFTNIRFSDESPMNAQISLKNKVIIDGYHNYYEYKYLSERAQSLSLILAQRYPENMSVGCNTVETDIILAPNCEKADTYSEMVFDIYLGTQLFDEESFAAKCKDYFEAVKEAGFEHKALKFYGGYAGEFYFEMTIPSDFAGDFTGSVLPFNQNHLVKREKEADYREFWDFGR